jgi:hypothetical protein
MRGFSSRRFLAAVMLPVTISGCSTLGSGLFDASPGARYRGVSEKRVLASVQRNCADLSVGEQQLGPLLAQDDNFRALTLRFSQGEMSNDEYVDRVLSLHPAADGNVPATGCVIAAVNNCIAGNCDASNAAAQAGSAVGDQDGAPEQAIAMPREGEVKATAGPKLEAGL